MINMQRRRKLSSIEIIRKFDPLLARAMQRDLQRKHPGIVARRLSVVTPEVERWEEVPTPRTQRKKRVQNPEHKGRVVNWRLEMGKLNAKGQGHGTFTITISIPDTEIKCKISLECLIVRNASSTYTLSVSKQGIKREIIDGKTIREGPFSAMDLADKPTELTQLLNIIARAESDCAEILFKRKKLPERLEGTSLIPAKHMKTPKERTVHELSREELIEAGQLDEDQR